jgi:hypothetical protein
MALTLTETKIYSRYSSRNFYFLVWDNLDEADTTPNVVQMPSSISLKMKVAGNFGTGGHVTLQGSMDGITYTALNDSTGSPIDLTTAGEVQISSNHVYRYIRPKVTAGTGVDVDVTVLAIP